MPFGIVKTLNPKLIGLVLGPLAFILGLILTPSDMPFDTWMVICLATFMLIWWISEAVPLAVTALLPVLLLPMTGVMSMKDAAAPYASDVVFLFLGGFLLATAIEKWNLHRRIALNIIKLTGTGANRIILGFMLATAGLSMWISNTAATVMMLPIATSVITLLIRDEDAKGKGVRNFSLVLMLSIAYSANVGGTATLIGSPPNVLMAGILEAQYGITVSFLDWMKIGLPFSLIMLAIIYQVLVKWMYPNKISKFDQAATVVSNQLKVLGAPTVQEKRVLIVFISTALLWVFRQMINDLVFFFELTDSGIALLAGIMLFVVFSGDKKSSALLVWKDTERLPWGILLLFGGGLSLANALNEVGLIDAIGQTFANIENAPMLWIVLSLATVSLFATEFMSNVALTSVLIPVVAAVAVGTGSDVLQFAIPVTLAASCAFMLPMATPPNAIVFASNRITVAQMMRAGIVHNLIAIVVIWLFSTYLVPLIL